jgi:hypothetical protein
MDYLYCMTKPGGIETWSRMTFWRSISIRRSYNRDEKRLEDASKQAYTA